MKNRVKKLLACAGTVGVMTAAMAVPAMAETTEESGNIETVQAYDWSDKAAADVITYANIRSGADISYSRVGMLPAGAVATIVGEENGWIQIVSGEVEGYIRGDLLVSGAEAQELFHTVYGDGEIVEATPVDEAAEAAAQQAAEAEAAAQQAAEAEAAAQVQSAGVSYSGSDLDLMAAIIECEAGGESYEGKIGVGAVIMNRMRSSQFPNTLSEVIYQSGQFSPVASGKLASVLSRGANQDCYDAARDVFAGANTIGDCLFFHAGSGNGLTIGNQTFY